MMGVGIRAAVAAAVGAAASGYPASSPANLGSQPPILEDHLINQTYNLTSTTKPTVDSALESLELKPSDINTEVTRLKTELDTNEESTIETIKLYAQTFNRLSKESTSPTSKDTLSEIKVTLIQRLFSLTLTNNDGTINGKTMDDIKEIVTNLQVSPDDLKPHLDTIGTGIPKLKTWFEQNEQWIKQNDDNGCRKALPELENGHPKEHLYKIQTSLAELRTIISQHASLQNKIGRAHV